MTCRRTLAVVLALACVGALVRRVRTTAPPAKPNAPPRPKPAPWTVPAGWVSSAVTTEGLRVTFAAPATATLGRDWDARHRPHERVGRRDDAPLRLPQGRLRARGGRRTLDRGPLPAAATLISPDRPGDRHRPGSLGRDDHDSLGREHPRVEAHLSQGQGDHRVPRR